VKSDRAPMRKVVKNNGWESRPVFKRGMLSGSASWWKLELECGHHVKRKTNGCLTKLPKSACCGEWGRAAVHVPDGTPKDELALLDRIHAAGWDCTISNGFTCLNCRPKVTT